mgnify:CR=1 FL=1
MKFKVGDRVKYKQNGEIFKITVVDRSYTNFPYRVKNKSGYECWFEEEELESANYTYEDLKKSPIGTKVTFENGKVLVKDDEDRYENSKTYRHNEDLDGIKDNSDYGRIIKIEEPEYTTVYASKVEILDEVEKRYLRGVIRPFRDKVKTIKKGTLNINDEQYISINFENTANNFALPNFKKGTMYKGMGVDKKYTLEELGL